MRYNIAIVFAQPSTNNFVSGYLSATPMTDSLEEIQGARDELQQLYTSDRLNGLTMYDVDGSMLFDDNTVVNRQVAEHSVNKTFVVNSTMSMQIVEYPDSEQEDA